MPIIKQNRHINKLNKPNKNKIGKGGDFMSIYKAGRPSKYNPTTKKGVEPAKCAGEYRIRNAEGALTYIGETNNLKRRMQQHCYNGKMSNGQNAGGTFEWKKADGRSTSVTRREHERQKIKEHSPAMNCSRGGEGRVAGR